MRCALVGSPRTEETRGARVYAGLAGRAALGALLSLALAACGCAGADLPRDAGEADAGALPDGGSERNDGGGGGGPDGGGQPDAGVPADGGSGTPIQAPEATWTWVDFPQAVCGNGSPTGIGVNLRSTATRALIFLQGGGACWDYDSCYVQKSAANLTTGVNQASFEAAASKYTGGIFDRTNPGNPFKDASFVFVPYCTGDVHSGTIVQSYTGKPTHHVGYRNLGLYLERLVPTFAGVSHVTLIGTSAGGCGVAFNADRVQGAFGSTRVDVVDDSGPWFANPAFPEAREQTFRSAWNLNASLPPDCPACTTSLDALFTHVATKHPTHRFALLSYSQDSVVQSYFTMSSAQFTSGLGALMTSFQGRSNLRYFVASGTGHVLVGNMGTVSQGGVTLQSWLTAMVTDSSSWVNLKP